MGRNMSSPAASRTISDALGEEAERSRMSRRSVWSAVLPQAVPLALILEQYASEAGGEVGGGDAFEQGRLLAADGFPEELLLAAEIAADQGRIDAGVTGNLAQADIVVALAREVAAGRVEDRLARRRGVAEPGLNGREHGVHLAPIGARSTLLTFMSTVVDKPWGQA